MGVEANGTNKAFSTSFPTLLAESFIRAVLGGMAEVERSSRRGEHDGGRDVSPLKWTHSSSQLLSTFPGGTWINCSGRFVSELFYFPCVIITLNTVEMRWYTLAVDCVSGLWVMSLSLATCRWAFCLRCFIPKDHSRVCIRFSFEYLLTYCL